MFPARDFQSHLVKNNLVAISMAAKALSSLSDEGNDDANGVK